MARTEATAKINSKPRDNVKTHGKKVQVTIILWIVASGWKKNYLS